MLKTSVLATAGIAIAGLLQGCSNADAQTACGTFLETKAELEQNLTDGDAEVLLFAKAPVEGLRQLVVRNPRGVELELTTANTLGQREFLFESAEPPDLGAVLAAFPPGTYSFEGTTVSGDCLTGAAQLSHVSAPGTTLLTPMQDEVVAPDQVTLSWASVPEAEGYVVELTNETSGAVYAFDILPPITDLAVPAALIDAGAEYTFAVATSTSTGNVSSVELSFTTTP